MGKGTKKKGWGIVPWREGTAKKGKNGGEGHKGKS